MEKFSKGLNKNALLLLTALFFIFLLALPAKAEPSLTAEEKEYLSQAKVLKVVSIDGIAPLYYQDSKGEIKGIGVSFLNKIAEPLGLVCEYEIYDSVAAALFPFYA